MRTSLFALLVVLSAAYCHGQPPNSDCSGALVLCAQQPQLQNNTGAVGLPGFCPGTQAVLWYTFTTNSVGGAVSVSVSNIDCPDVVGMGDELAVVVLSGNGSCAPASFSAVSSCAFGTQQAITTAQALLPNTQYWVVVGGALNGGSTIPAQCGFNVMTSGPGADIVGVDFGVGPNVQIGEGESTQLVAYGGPPYDWTPTTGLSGNGISNPIASPPSTVFYTVSTTLNGCTYSADVFVEVIRRIQPPNTFTPNGDGFNDTWLIPGIADYPGAEVRIHDRWGQVVYRSTGYREPWDGTNNGTPVAVGTYYYHIQLNQLEGRSPPYTGFISLVR